VLSQESPVTACRAVRHRHDDLDFGIPDVAEALRGLGYDYLDQGRYAEAEPLPKRSLAIREKVLGPDHPDVGQSLAALAELYHAEDRDVDAEPDQRDYLPIARNRDDRDQGQY
jgi:hypothetical protein